MSKSSITATLGLDKKPFDKGIKDAEKGANRFGQSAKSSMADAGKGASGLGRVFSGLGRLLPALSIAAFAKKVFDVGVAARDTNKEFERLNRPRMAGQFSTLSDLQSQAIQSAENLKKMNEALNGTETTLGRIKNAAKWATVSVGDFTQNAVGKALYRNNWQDQNTRKKTENEAALAASLLDKDKTAAWDKYQSEALIRQESQMGGVEGSEMDAAEQRKKERLGQIQKEEHDPNGKTPVNQRRIEQKKAQAESEYQNEIFLIGKKHRIMEEEIKLQEKLATLTGSESKRRIDGLRAQLEHTAKLRAIERAPGSSGNNSTENAQLDSQAKIDSHNLKQAQIAEEMKSPQQKIAEREQQRAINQQRRAAEKRLADKEDMKRRNSGDISGGKESSLSVEGGKPWDKPSQDTKAEVRDYTANLDQKEVAKERASALDSPASGGGDNTALVGKMQEVKGAIESGFKDLRTSIESITSNK